MKVRGWFCMRCQKAYPVVRGIIQCDAPPDKPLTGEQMREAVQWAMDHPIVTGDE